MSNKRVKRMVFIVIRFIVITLLCGVLVFGGEKLYAVWKGIAVIDALHFKEIFDLRSYGSLDKEYAKYAWSSVFVYSASLLLFLFNIFGTIRDIICVMTKVCIKCDNFVKCHKRIKLERSY